MDDLQERQKELKQQIRKQFGFPLKYAQFNTRHITATEVKLNLDIWRQNIDKLCEEFYVHCENIMHNLYIKYLGEYKMRKYILKMIKTM